jgi:hypothetical protein
MVLQAAITGIAPREKFSIPDDPVTTEGRAEVVIAP